MLAALEVEQQLGAAGLDDLALEVSDVAVGVDLVPLAAALDLLGHAEDDAVAALHLVGGDIGEVPQLNLVDLSAELDVDAPQPPAVGELDREVASPLARFPSADPAAATEDAGEVDEPVVPVVAAWNREQLRRLPASARKRRAVGAEHPVLVLAGLGDRIHRVAPEDEELPALGAVGFALPLDVEALRRQEAGDRVGRVPAVAEIRDVVKPQLGLTRAIWHLGRLSRLLLAAVGVGAEHARQQHPDGRVDELVRIEPAHHRPARRIRGRMRSTGEEDTEAAHPRRRRVDRPRSNTSTPGRRKECWLSARFRPRRPRSSRRAPSGGPLPRADRSRPVDRAGSRRLARPAC